MVTSFDKTSCQLSGDILCRRLELKLRFSFLFIYSRETRFKFTGKIICRFLGRVGNSYNLPNNIQIYFVFKRTKS